MVQLTEGAKAPLFTGVDQHGNSLSLSDFAGRKLILYFYPKDNTPGCTAEACDLNENLDAWQSKGFAIVGVSPDSALSHQRFADKFMLRFPLIADTDKVILQQYGAWGEKKNYGKTYMGVIRTTFVIDEQGVILRIFTKVDTKNHTAQINKALNI